VGVADTSLMSIPLMIARNDNLMMRVRKLTSGRVETTRGDTKIESSRFDAL
jgi:hypothetical protein